MKTMILEAMKAASPFPIPPHRGAVTNREQRWLLSDESDDSGSDEGSEPIFNSPIWGQSRRHVSSRCLKLIGAAMSCRELLGVAKDCRDLLRAAARSC